MKESICELFRLFKHNPIGLPQTEANQPVSTAVWQRCPYPLHARIRELIGVEIQIPVVGQPRCIAPDAQVRQLAAEAPERVSRIERWRLRVLRGQGGVDKQCLPDPIEPEEFEGAAIPGAQVGLAVVVERVHRVHLERARLV